MKTSKADRYFSMFIRLRDSDENGYCKCVTCGAIRFWKNLDCGHYVLRQHQGARFNEINCSAQCKGCNGFEAGKKIEHKQFIIETYGQQVHDLLKSAERVYFKRSKLEMSLLAREYKIKAEQLLKEKGL